MIFGSRFSDEFQMEYGPVPGGVTIISCNSDADEIAVPAEVPQIVEAREEAAIRVRTRARVASGWRCSDRTRAIFEACTVGGRSAAEVAREFGVSSGFVRIVRHRGLAKERKAAKRV